MTTSGFTTGEAARPRTVCPGCLWAAWGAPDRAAVDRFFLAAVEAGAEVLHEPRVWPRYHPSYYGAFVRDPDGHNIEAVCHAAESPPEDPSAG